MCLHKHTTIWAHWSTGNWKSSSSVIQDRLVYSLITRITKNLSAVIHKTFFPTHSSPPWIWMTEWLRAVFLHRDQFSLEAFLFHEQAFSMIMSAKDSLKNLTSFSFFHLGCDSHQQHSHSNSQKWAHVPS